MKRRKKMNRKRKLWRSKRESEFHPKTANKERKRKIKERRVNSSKLSGLKIEITLLSRGFDLLTTRNFTRSLTTKPSMYFMSIKASSNT